MTRIKHLAGRSRFVRLGKVSRGIVVTKTDDKGRPIVRNGREVTYPKATDYFVIKEEWPGVAEEVMALYGPQPKELDIEFYFDEEDQTFPQSMKLYRSDKQLRCRGDGQSVITRRAFIKRGDKDLDATVIHDGTFSTQTLGVYGGWDNVPELTVHLQTEWQEQYGWGEQGLADGVVVPCLGPKCPEQSPSGCRATGRLLFGIRGLRRFGFMEMTVHQYAIVGINSQLDLTRAFTNALIGTPTILNVPFKLRLTGPQQMSIPRRVRQDNGTYAVEERVTDVWTPEIQPDPEWVAKVYEVQGERHLLPEPAPEGRVPALRSSPEEDAPLEYEPEVEEEIGEGPARFTQKQIDDYWKYAKKHDVRGSAESMLEKLGGDFEKALVELRQSRGDL